MPKIYHIDKNCLSSFFYLFKNTFKVDLHYIFYILLTTVFNLKIKLKFKLDANMCSLKNLKEISQK